MDSLVEINVIIDEFTILLRGITIIPEDFHVSFLKVRKYFSFKNQERFFISK